MTEEQLQAECYNWFHNTYHKHRKMLFHVDNNSWNKIIGAKKKALGVNSGVSDFIFILQGRVVFIEMKIPGGTQSDEQKEFQSKVEERGFLYLICYSLDQFKTIILSLI